MKCLKSQVFLFELGLISFSWSHQSEVLGFISKAFILLWTELPQWGSDCLPPSCFPTLFCFLPIIRGRPQSWAALCLTRRALAGTLSSVHGAYCVPDRQSLRLAPILCSDCVRPAPPLLPPSPCFRTLLHLFSSSGSCCLFFIFRAEPFPLFS